MLGAVNDSPDTMDEGPTLGLDLPEVPPPGADGLAYRVLARKYRPQTFAELIGQDAMVQTLANAIKRGRLAHAFLMTGVRGVGKTSTARLIAKGLNCIGPDGKGGSTIDPCGVCDPCVAIAQGRHIDVIEMDAASHTGVDDVREIIEAVRYAAVSARYKIYIIDEVHMLSKNAFNALLKTLEEPPPHVKFLFATTEVNKVPVTVLSRCQRFDLRRITPALLFDHYAMICAKEAVEADEEALRMIAVAAEGSVRDGLSMLDQAIAYADLDGDGRISTAQVQGMLGLSDGAATRRLLSAMLAGDAAAAVMEARAHYALGAEPIGIVRGLMTLAHGIALRRATGVDDPALPPDDRAAIADWAAQIGIARAHRLWQLLLKGHEEVARAADPLAALDMAVLRIAHAATMPDPDELARLIGSGEGVAQGASAHPAPTTPSASPAPTASHAPTPPPGAEAPPPPSEPAATPRHQPPPETMADVVRLLLDHGQHINAALVEQEGRLVSITPGSLVLERTPRIGEIEATAIAGSLGRATGARWTVSLSDARGERSLSEVAVETAEAERQRLREHPVVAAAIASFPGAELLHRPRSASE